MAYANTLHLPRTFSPAATVAGLVARFKEAHARRAVFLRTLTELDAFSDRDLADIGISRLSIRDVAYEAAYGA